MQIYNKSQAGIHKLLPEMIETATVLVPALKITRYIIIFFLSVPMRIQFKKNFILKINGLLFLLLLDVIMNSLCYFICITVSLIVESV